jgi:hypothetical protein
LQLINPSTSPNELNTTLTPHSIIHGDACFAYFNKVWGIPQPRVNRMLKSFICVYSSANLIAHPLRRSNLVTSDRLKPLTLWIDLLDSVATVE